MSVVDLSKRISDNWDEYNQYKKSEDSKIYIKGDIILDNVGPASVNITAGERWYDYTKNKYYKIPFEGIKLKPGKNITIETSQKFALPYNIFGVIYGTGKNIFRGGFVSSGKINPGFCGYLKIGYYNGSDGTICFRKGDLLACCAFHEMETHIENALEHYLSDVEAEILDNRGIRKVINWCKDNWYSLLSILISICALVVSIIYN